MRFATLTLAVLLVSSLHLNAGAQTCTTGACPTQAAVVPASSPQKTWYRLTNQPGYEGYGALGADGYVRVEQYRKVDAPKIVPASYTSPVQNTAAPAQTASYGDPYGFINWLNSVRAQYGLGAVSHDPNLDAWAHQNNLAQAARGLGHHIMGAARRQNSGMGAFANMGSMWLASPGHAAALLDPTIRFAGIAGMGQWWTFNAY